METKWYAVYTRPHKEKRASSLLSGMGIENFIPLNKREIKGFAQKKFTTQPLISSLLFINASESQLSSVCKLSDINLVYWKSAPAVIQESEIDMLKNLSVNYINLKVEKMKIDPSASVSIIEKSGRGFFTSHNKFTNEPIQVELPSFGYAIIAEREMEDSSVYNRENVFVSFFQKLTRSAPLFEAN